MKTAEFEHHKKCICESKSFVWYIYSEGYIEKVRKSNRDVHRLSAYLKRKHSTIKMKSKEYRLARLVAQHFMKDFNPSNNIGYRDANRENCNIENLFQYSHRLHGTVTGHMAKSKKVILQEYRKNPVQFRSVRICAKYLHVSHQTLSDYLNGKVKNSVLKKYGRKLYYK